MDHEPHELISGIRRVLAEAFEHDPLTVWIFPDDEHRRELIAAWFGLLVEGYVLTTAGTRVDVVEDDGEIVAAALWRVPGDSSLEMPAAPTLGGLLAALVGHERSVELGEGFQSFVAGWPEQPLAYLHFLGVRPSHQGLGLGSQVLVPGMAAAAELGLPARLETTNPDNPAFYRRHGFEVTEEFTVPHAGPRTWGMVRPPGT